MGVDVMPRTTRLPRGKTAEDPTGRSDRRRRTVACARRPTTAALILIGLLTATGCATAGDTIPLEIRGHTLQVELARTEAEQARGLMYRKSLPADRGMLFVYPSARQVYYWMKNTFIPLSIAFIGDDRRIINMADMPPNNSTRTFASHGPCRYVLEVNQGWFKEHGVQPGDIVTFTLPATSG